MNWIEDVERELARAAEAERSGNAGRVRTSARRAVGVAISELQRRFPQRYYGRDFVEQIRSFANDAALPDETRNAASRLGSRLSLNFTSPSEHPIDDARMIIEYIRRQVG